MLPAPETRWDCFHGEYITAGSYFPENLNMSREKETERERLRGAEGMGRGQCFPCLFLTSEEAGDSSVMRDNNWMIILFRFHP